MRASKARSASGFSLVELTVVGAVTIIVAALAIPNAMTAVANVRLRSAGNNIASVLQATRMGAIRANRAMSAHQGTDNGVPVLYADISQPYGSLQPNEPRASFTGQLTLLTSAPAGTVAVSPGFTPVTGDPSFSSHGVPLLMDASTGAIVLQPAGFVFYVQQARSLGPTGFAAVVLTPGGRVRVLIWDAHTSSWN